MCLKKNDLLDNTELIERTAFAFPKRFVLFLLRVRKVSGKIKSCMAQAIFLFAIIILEPNIH